MKSVNGTDVRSRSPCPVNEDFHRFSSTCNLRMCRVDPRSAWIAAGWDFEDIMDLLEVCHVLPRAMC